MSTQNLRSFKQSKNQTRQAFCSHGTLLLHLSSLLSKGDPQSNMLKSSKPLMWLLAVNNIYDASHKYLKTISRESFKKLQLYQLASCDCLTSKHFCLEQGWMIRSHKSKSQGLKIPFLHPLLPHPPPLPALEIRDQSGHK